jgi:hypothetical protein
MNVRSFVLASLLLVLGAVDAQTPRDVHGSADVYAAPGVALAWGILRGPTEAATSVVIRVVTDPKAYSWLAAVGIDPFTKAEQPLQTAAPISGTVDLAIPRSRFGDLPRTELRFYDAAPTAQAAAPKLVVFYLGIPDTTPEFADRAKLDLYLSDRIARARSQEKTP